MTDENERLTHRLHEAVKEPQLCIELDTNLFGGQPLMRLTKPGETARSKRVDLLGRAIVGDVETQRHSAILRIVADMLEEVGR